MSLEHTDLKSEIEEHREHLRPLIKVKNVSIGANEPEKMVLSADPFWLSQAIENVLKMPSSTPPTVLRLW